jgi:Fe2+ transport system protein FeoA
MDKQKKESLQNNTHRLLSKMNPGDEGLIFLILAKGKIKQRLLEMGFIRGTHLKIERTAPMGDPMELVIRGYHLTIRKEDSQCILVSHLY